MKGVVHVMGRVKYHEPVLLDEVMGLLDPGQGKVVWDATVGTGGHAEAIVERIKPGGKVYCSDRDMESLEVARERLGKHGDAVEFFHLDFRDVGTGRIDFPAWDLDGILLDMGISTYQLRSEDRGFSFSSDDPLDMRMDRNDGLTAAEIVNEYGYGDIKRVLKEYGEEPRAAIIARKIVTVRARSPIRTTSELCKVVESAVGRGSRGKRHPATLTFQALRIAVNKELEKLFEGIEGLVNRLRSGGRLVVISFHSLEDRIVKTLFRKLSVDCRCPEWYPVCKCGNKARVKVLTSRVIKPGEREVRRNPASRSARLRALEKI